jgi:hypothetical protein
MAGEVLLPDIAGQGGYPLFSPSCKPVGCDPVELGGYSVYCVLDHLDSLDPPFCLFVVPDSKGSCLLYRHVFEGRGPPVLDTLGLRIASHPNGRLVLADPELFSRLDARQRLVRIKRGDWLKCKAAHHAIGALYHLGVISDLSSPAFELLSDPEPWISQVNDEFHVAGVLEESLPVIFSRLRFASVFFGIDLAGIFAEVGKDLPYCFGPLVPVVGSSHELEVLTDIFPIFGSNKSSLRLLLNCLEFAWLGLRKLRFNVGSLDDFADFGAALRRFQAAEELPAGVCDGRTAARLVSLAAFPLFEPVPPLKAAGIAIQVSPHMDFPMVDQLPRGDGDPLLDRVRVEVNRAVTGVADPSAKVAWMNEQIDRDVAEYDKKCGELAEKVGAIEKKVTMTTMLLKGVAEQSAVAAARIANSMADLKKAYTAHEGIEGKFEMLRNRLFYEQQKTRTFLFIGFFVAFLGALRLFWR